MALITLTTDFGSRDGYVACMKGVILTIAPGCTIVDVTHDIEPGNVLHAAYVIRQTVPWFPPATAHVAVVDPGVGTDRRIIAARVGRQIVIAPDNGSLSLLHHAGLIEEAHVVNSPAFALAKTSATFHGRDIMAPTAAHLVNGAKLMDVGPATDHVEVLQLANAHHGPDGTCRGVVIHHDAFGNLITNLQASDVQRVQAQRKDAHVFLGEEDIGPVRRTYGDVPASEPIALIGSGGALEIAIHSGNAWAQFCPKPQTVVELR